MINFFAKIQKKLEPAVRQELNMVKTRGEGDTVNMKIYRKKSYLCIRNQSN